MGPRPLGPPGGCANRLPAAINPAISTFAFINASWRLRERRIFCAPLYKPCAKGAKSSRNADIGVGARSPFPPARENGENRVTKKIPYLVSYNVALRSQLPIGSGAGNWSECCRKRPPLPPWSADGHCVDRLPDRKSTRLNSSHLGISYA